MTIQPEPFKHESRLTPGSDLFRHPLMCDLAILPTTAIEHFVNTVRTWLELLLPGALVIGNWRIGKSHATQFLARNLPELLGLHIPTYVLRIHDVEGKYVSRKEFFVELLRALGYGLTQRGNASDKFHQAVDFVAERVRANGEHRALLFVDEAQWMTTAMYRYLMAFHNELRSKDVRLIVILVGQPELRQVREGMVGEGKGHILGRFMTATHEFRGVTGVEDLRKIARSLDQDSEYPPGSGWSYTYFFVPQAFEAGWRLEDHVDALWRALTDVCAANSLPEITELPMQAIVAMFRALMLELHDRDAPDLGLPAEAVTYAIKTIAFQQIQDHVILLASQRATAAARPA